MVVSVCLGLGGRHAAAKTPGYWKAVASVVFYWVLVLLAVKVYWVLA